MNGNMTKAQRQWLESIAGAPVSVLDISTGGAQQCIQRLLRAGLVAYVSMPDWRDSTYQITDAGREARTHIKFVDPK